MASSAFYVISKEVENCVFRQNLIFRHTCMYKRPILTKQRNYNNFVQISYSYLRYTDRIMDMFLLLFAVILSELLENPRRNDLVTKRIYKRICVKDTTFLVTGSPSYVIFCRIFPVLPPFRLLQKFCSKQQCGRETFPLPHIQCLRS